VLNGCFFCLFVTSATILSLLSFTTTYAQSSTLILHCVFGDNGKCCKDQGVERIIFACDPCVGKQKLNELPRDRVVEIALIIFVISSLGDAV
jgi:hypothetical protein